MDIIFPFGDPIRNIIYKRVPVFYPGVMSVDDEARTGTLRTVQCEVCLAVYAIAVKFCGVFCFTGIKRIAFIRYIRCAAHLFFRAYHKFFPAKALDAEIAYYIYGLDFSRIVVIEIIYAYVASRSSDIIDLYAFDF